MNVSPPSPRILALLSYSTAFIAGAAVMMIEIGGARLLTPFFGVSLFVWTAQIAVTLLALALGYWLGGQKADRQPSLRAPFVILLLSVAYLQIIPWSAPFFIRWMGGWGLRPGVFFCALVLFGPPLVLLGMLTPYLLRILSDSLQYLGRKAGGLYAVSTLGSLLGTLAAGYFLLPLIGASKIIYLTALILILPAIGLWFILEKKAWSGILIIILCLWPLRSILQTPALVYKTLGRSSESAMIQELHRVESFYGKIQIVEFNRRYRTMLVNGIPQAQVDITTGKNSLEYNDLMRHLGRAYAPGAESALFLGLGAGVLEQDFRRAGLKTVTVEIDPAIAEVSRRYFNWEAPDASLYLEDARRFLERPEEKFKEFKKFDLIFVDCFSGEELPFYLMSRQALAKMKERLSPRGVLIINFPSISRSASPLAAACLHKTLQTLFPQVNIYAGSNYQAAEEICNYLFTASAMSLTELGFNAAKSPQELISLLSRRVEFSHPQAIVIQDNFNPMDVYEQEAREFFRRRIWQNVGWELLLQ